MVWLPLVSVLSLWSCPTVRAPRPAAPAHHSYQRSYLISERPCGAQYGLNGTCMFMYDCEKTNGRHMFMCKDSFIFRSCCGHGLTRDQLARLPLHAAPSLPPRPGQPRPHFMTSPSSTPRPPPSPAPSSLTAATTTYTTTTTTSTERWGHLSPSHGHGDESDLSNMVDSTWGFGHHWPAFVTKPESTRPRPEAKPTPAAAAPAAGPTTAPAVQTMAPADPTTTPATYTTTATPPATSSRPSTPATFPAKDSGRRPIGPSSTRAPPGKDSQSLHRPRPSQRPNPLPRPLSSTTTGAPFPADPAGPSGQPSRGSLSANKTSDECGVPMLSPSSQHEMRVVGGKNAQFGVWPWQVSVRRTSFFGFSSTHRCGGALLNEQWVATAGHCVDDLLTSQIRIRVGEYDFSSAVEPYPHQERGVTRKVVHPNYNFFTYEYDLALARLDGAVELAAHVQPICLPGSDDLLIGEPATVTGWGRLSEGGALPSVLQQVTVPIVSNEKCKNMFLRAGRHEFIPDIFMCAGFDDGGRDSCQGDSGGPLQVKGRDGRYFLAGIISWGIGCAEKNLPGVCTRISKFVPWILQTVA